MGTSYYTQTASNPVYIVSRRWGHVQNASQGGGLINIKIFPSIAFRVMDDFVEIILVTLSEWDSMINVLALLGHYAEI